MARLVNDIFRVITVDNRQVITRGIVVRKKPLDQRRKERLFEVIAVQRENGEGG
jgi:hypothetical protein